MKEINRGLETQYQILYQDLIRRRKLKKYLRNLTISERLIVKEIERLEQEKEKELEDVNRLEKMGLKRNPEEALEKERQEYLFAVMAYQAKQKELEAIHYQQKVLGVALEKLNGTSDKFEKVKKRLFFSAQLNDPKVEAELKKVKENILYLSSQKGEINEAKIAGSKGIQTLGKLRSELDKIDIWGTRDVDLIHKYHGKGNYSSYQKKKHVDRSKGLLFKALGALNRFQEELKDVSKSLGIDFNEHLEVLENFLDIFLDNLISDWIVKNEIVLAFKSIEIVDGKINRLLKMLDRENDLCDVGIDAANNLEKEILFKYTKR